MESLGTRMSNSAPVIFTHEDLADIIVQNLMDRIRLKGVSCPSAAAMAPSMLAYARPIATLSRMPFVDCRRAFMKLVSAALHSGGLNLVVMVATYISSPHGDNSPSGGAALLLPSAVNSTEKAKHRQQTEMLDMWITLHGDNLYPCREEKERIAKDMSMSYVQMSSCHYRAFSDLETICANNVLHQSKTRMLFCIVDGFGLRHIGVFLSKNERLSKRLLISATRVKVKPSQSSNRERLGDQVLM
uniref:DYW_deaminase domain-containing protein n=1 Tax=Ascaris lumbricoides TaxID=6252 RepID=A0A0M3I5C5_ASCLU